jgi:hypothetical protein
MSETMVSGDSNLPSDEWKDFDFSTVKVEKPRATRSLPKREVIHFAVTGFLGGAITWLMHLAVKNWVMFPLFCRTPDTASVCTNSGSISFVIALIVTGIILAAILASRRVFRAVVITAAVFVCLGALWPILNTRGAIWATILTALFAVVLYLFFALIAAIKRNLLSVILMAALIAAFWLLVRI